MADKAADIFIHTSLSLIKKELRKACQYVLNVQQCEEEENVISVEISNMASDSATLSSLEELLNEFFDGSTNNERKRQIEELLNNFGLQEGSWRQCMFFLSNTSNQYVLMYSFSIFENLINQRWHGLQGTDKQQIRKYMYDFLISKHKHVPTFIRNKSIKVVVNIGRLDWPMFYPTFFSNVMQLLQNEATSLIGVLMLQMISEEFIFPHEDLSMSRRQELKECLLQHIPNALNVLTELLNSISQKLKHVTSTVTPPLSPNRQSPHNTPGHSPVHRVHSSSNPLLNSPLQKIEAVVMNPESEELCNSIFNCLTQYISWLPLSRFITPVLVTKIFNYAEYGCSIAVQRTGNTLGATQVGINAMSCINEILSKKFIPAEYESFLLQMFQQTFKLLQLMTKDVTDAILLGVDDTYLDKFTEFLNLFIGNHLRRFEPSNHFPTIELLYLLLKYTIIQCNPEQFIACLDIWMIFLDYLIDKVTSCITANFKLASMEKYVTCLQELLVELLKKVQFLHCADWLDTIDMEKYDDDSETDWEKFLQPCLEVIGKLSELLPEQSFTKCYEVFQKNVDIYFELSTLINNETLEVVSEDECKKLHVSLLDLGTSVRIMGRLSSLFIDDVNFRGRFEQGQSLLERLVQAAMFGGFYRTYKLKTAQNYLSTDLIEVHAQAIASVQAFSNWLAKCHLATQSQPTIDEKFRPLVTSILDFVCPLFEPQVPERISLAAAHLLVSITTTVRPNFFLGIKQGQELFSQVDGNLRQCNETVQTLVFRSLSNALILPWPLHNDNQQEWEVRSSNHRKLIESLSKEFELVPDVATLMSNNELREKFKPIIKCTCHILSDIVRSASIEGTTSRKVIYNSIQGHIDLCSTILTAYVADADIADKILLFLLECVKGLKIQIGTTGVETLVSRLLELLKRDQMIQILRTGNESGINALDRFLKMLELIVQEHNPSFKKLLPSVISFGLENILPVLNDHNIPDLKMSLLEFLHQLLLQNWRYFFKSTIINKMNGEDQLQHDQQFLTILKAFGQPLMETEIALFKKSIQVLESINAKNHLYQKAIFQSTMLSSFLQVLLNALIQKSHNLLQEEIIQAVYSMVASNFDAYFAQFIPSFLMNLSGLTDHQKSQLHENYKRHQDVPSFTTSLQQFIGDLRYLQIVNNSLPPGTIAL